MLLNIPEMPVLTLNLQKIIFNNQEKLVWIDISLSITIIMELLLIHKIIIFNNLIIMENINLCLFI
jgi:hypothetical protein